MYFVLLYLDPVRRWIQRIEEITIYKKIAKIKDLNKKDFKKMKVDPQERRFNN